MVYPLLYDSFELLLPFVAVKDHIISSSYYPSQDTFDYEDFTNAIGIKDISLTSVLNYRDMLSKDNEDFEIFKQIKNKNRKLFRTLSECFYNAACLLMIGDVERAFQQIPDFLKNGMSNDEAIFVFYRNWKQGYFRHYQRAFLYILHGYEICLS